LPNPSSEYFFLKVNSDKVQKSSMTLKDMKGQILLHEYLDLKQGINILQLQPILSTGIYFIEITTDQGQKTIKHQRL
jgi:response regulator of citrate/malate metabolism